MRAALPLCIAGLLLGGTALVARPQPVERLLAAMRHAGLSEARAVALPGTPAHTALEGVLPGATDDEIVLAAHCGTVAASPGGDGDSGCGVALAAAADLARTPRRRRVRVVLFDEEGGLAGSRAWLARLDRAHREHVLAALAVEKVGWAGSAGPLILAAPVRLGGGETAAPPGWLVHAVLRSGEAVGWSFAVLDARAPVLAQLVARAVRLHTASAADAFLAAGIPAVTLSDRSPLAPVPAGRRPALDPARLDRWSLAIAAAVRRLDALAGRPVPEDRYLVAFRRVWLRRDLYWAGFLLWALAVVRNRPPRRGPSREPAPAQAPQHVAEDRARRRAAYLPGFWFRLLLLAAVLLAPVLAVLLYPAAALSLVPPRAPRLRLPWAVLALLPLLLFAAALAFALARGVVDGLSVEGTVGVLLVLAAAAACMRLPARWG
jgi:peptidase M28-like protein